MGAADYDCNTEHHHWDCSQDCRIVVMDNVDPYDHLVQQVLVEIQLEVEAHFVEAVDSLMVVDNNPLAYNVLHKWVVHWMYNILADDKDKVDSTSLVVVAVDEVVVDHMVNNNLADMVNNALDVLSMDLDLVLVVRNDMVVVLVQYLHLNSNNHEIMKT